MKLPIISLAILAGQLGLARSNSGTDVLRLLDEFQSYYTGFVFHANKFYPSNLAIGYAPWVVKRFVLPIARPRMPVRGLPISIS